MRALIAAAALAVLLLAPASASAQSSQGADVLWVDDCMEFGDLTFCQQGKIVTNAVFTPSGRLLISVHIDIDVTWDTPNCDETQTQRYNSHSHGDIDTGNVEGSQYVARYDAQWQCVGGPVVNCHSDVMVHYANGTYQFWRNEGVCTPEET